MEVCVADGEYAQKLVALCHSVRVRGDADEQKLLKNAFSNHYKPYLYYCRRIGSRNYGVSFGITVAKATMRITEFALLNEDVLQPHSCSAKDYAQCKERINELIGKGVLERTVAKRSR